MLDGYHSWKRFQSGDNVKRTATIKDVATRAGCSVATVSRVLNGTGSASVPTREKVLAAADALGFQFSEIGRSLQSSTTRTIGCVVPSLANPVFADAVQGVQDALRGSGYQLLLACSNYDADEETAAVRMLLAKQVDGIVLTVSEVENSPALDLIRRRGMPCCLMFNTHAEDMPTSAVDNYAAARAVADAFAAHGHIHTGFLALRFKSSDRSRHRFEGFSAGCHMNGMAAPALLEIDEDGGNLPELLRDLLAENNRLSGIFASNDFLALAAVRAARELGRSVPSDLSIVGFDGIEIGRMTSPSLATVETEPRRMGQGAAKVVLAGLIEPDGKPCHAEKSASDTPSPDDGPAISFRFRPGGSLARPAAEKPTTEGQPPHRRHANPLSSSKR